MPCITRHGGKLYCHRGQAGSTGRPLHNPTSIAPALWKVQMETNADQPKGCTTQTMTMQARLQHTKYCPTHASLLTCPAYGAEASANECRLPSRQLLHCNRNPDAGMGSVNSSNVTVSRSKRHTSSVHSQNPQPTHCSINLRAVTCTTTMEER